MAKPRQLSSTGWYHIIGRGNNRQELFRQEKDFRRFLALLEEYRKRYALRISHYCLMPNHIHLLLFCEIRENLSKALQGINLSYSWRYRREYGFCGHVWQGRFKSFPIEKDSYLLECGRYIERNPVSAEMVSDPRDYPWSSYRFYTEGESNPLLTPDPGYLEFGQTQLERQCRYREYVKTARPYEIPNPERLHPVFQGW